MLGQDLTDRDVVEHPETWLLHTCIGMDLAKLSLLYFGSAVLSRKRCFLESSGVAMYQRLYIQQENE